MYTKRDSYRNEDIRQELNKTQNNLIQNEIETIR